MNGFDFKTVWNQYWPVILSGCVTVSCLVLTIVDGWHFLWTQTTARITGHEFNYYQVVAGTRYGRYVRWDKTMSVTYSYNFGGQEFKGQEVTEFSNRSGESNRFIAMHPTGSTITVWVNPFNVSQSTIRPGANLANALILLTISSLLTYALATVHSSEKSKDGAESLYNRQENIESW